MDVFGARATSSIVSKSDGATVVAVEQRWAGDFDTNLLEEVEHPNDLSGCHSASDVFGFGSRMGDEALSLGLPTDGAKAELDNEGTGRTSKWTIIGESSICK